MYDFRTVFQGKYYEFMTSDMRKKEVRTIEEMIEMDFTIYFCYDHWLDRPKADKVYFKDLEILKG